MDSLSRVAGLLLMLAGGLHMFGYAIAGWNTLTTQLVPIGALYVVLGGMTAVGKAGARWWAAMASGLGLIAAVQVLPSAPVPGWLMGLYIVFDIVIVGALSLSIARSLGAPDPANR